jgi:hypothetical protein
MTVGTRAQVWHGTADKTSGGLRKSDLIMKNGRIKSKKASRSAKNNQNLKKAGWTFKKGEFGAVRIEDKNLNKKKKTGKKSGKKKRGSKKKNSTRRRRR